MCGSMADIQSATAEIRRGKNQERKKKPDKNIMSASATQCGHNKQFLCQCQKMIFKQVVKVIWHKTASPPLHSPNPSIQSYWSGCVNMHLNVMHASLGPHDSTSQTASRSVQPLLHSSWQSVFGHARAVLFPKITPSHGALDPHLTQWFL